jgi:hypothetical protein
MQRTSASPAERHESPPPGPTQGGELLQCGRTQGGGPQATRIEEACYPEEGHEEDFIEEVVPGGLVPLNCERSVLASGPCLGWPLTDSSNHRGLEVSGLEDEGSVVSPLELCEKTGALRFEHKGYGLGGVA